jgi:hypothetical protein
LEGHDKRRLAYQALSNNSTSLMCSSNLMHCIHEATPPLPVFMQHNILDNAKLSENISSLKDTRTAIHKLLPEDLENPIKENVASTSGDQGPDEGPIEDHSGTTLVSCTCDAYQELFEIVHTAFSVEQFEYLICQIWKYHLTDEQWSKLKTVLDCCRLRFTNCQWDQLSHLLRQD